MLFMLVDNNSRELVRFPMSPIETAFLFVNFARASGSSCKKSFRSFDCRMKFCTSHRVSKRSDANDYIYILLQGFETHQAVGVHELRVALACHGAWTQKQRSDNRGWLPA